LLSAGAELSLEEIPHLDPEALTQALEGTQGDVDRPLLDLLVVPGIDPDSLGGLLLRPIPFGTQATAVHNVNLGAHSIDAAGKIMDNDLARGSMPQAAPGATVKATVSLPIDKMLGNRAELLPVAEGVGWFDKWGTKPLVVGPFMACSDASFGRICDAAGIPLTLAQQ